MINLFPRYVTFKTFLKMDELLDSFDGDVLHAFLLMERRVHLIFEGSLKGSVLMETIHYQHVLMYLLSKREGLVSKVEDYPYSGLHKNFPFEIRPDLEVNKDFLEWANRLHTVKQMGSIERGLKFRRFRFAGTRSMRRPPHFESYLSDLELFETFGNKG